MGGVQRITCLGLAVVLLALEATSAPKFGLVTNCGHKGDKDMVDVKVTWSPYLIKASTEYTINGSVTVHQEISDVTEGATIYVPGSPDPIYTVPPKESTCKDSNIIEALSMFNVTCPIKAGTKINVANMKYTLPGSGAIFTGDFIVEAWLKDKKGHQIVCVRTQFSIVN